VNPHRQPSKLLPLASNPIGPAPTISINHASLFIGRPQFTFGTDRRAQQPQAHSHFTTHSNHEYTNG
jgi:hypothetical protein